MRIDDIRPEAPSGEEGISRERQVAHAASPAAVDDRSLDLVAAVEELTLERGDEAPEVGVARAGVHLRDEEDAQGAQS
jgi:hypothetical protein